MRNYCIIVYECELACMKYTKFGNIPFHAVSVCVGSKVMM